MSIPWIEKYRPKTINDIELCENTMCKIKSIIESKEMPNIIITGVPGTGKTSTILCMASALFGEYIDDGLLELNASDNRGMKSAQETEMFCKKLFKLPSNVANNYAKHKIILYDEADNFTGKTQNMIKSYMEKHYETTRFAFTCNTSSSIIESIQSRCVILRYHRLSNERMGRKLMYICKVENINFTNEGINLIVNMANGDMRCAINQLQLIFNSYNKIDEFCVNQLCDRPQPLLIKELIYLCINKNLKDAMKCLHELISNGNSPSDITMSIMLYLKSSNGSINDDLVNKYYKKVCHTTFIISKGLDTKLQLSSLICSLINNND